MDFPISFAISTRGFAKSSDFSLRSLQNEKGIRSTDLFLRILKTAGYPTFARRLDERISQERYAEIDDALLKTLVYRGPGVDITAMPSDSSVREPLRFLLGSENFSLSWATSKNLSAILLKKNPEWLREIGEEFRKILEHRGRNLPKTPGEALLFEAFVGNVLALIPYSYPQEGEIFTVPTFLDGAWQNITYKVDKHILLMPEGTISSTPLTAYGFVSDRGPSFISFLGTAFPAGDGFLLGLLSDFAPGHSVGGLPYSYGKQALTEWFADKKGVRLYGMSLGGAVTLHVLKDFEEILSEIYAYSPPGLYRGEWPKRFDGKGCKINIYCQPGDIVPSLGFFPEGDRVNLYEVLPGEDGKSDNMLRAHAGVYTGADQVHMLKGSAEHKNRSRTRKFLTGLHRLFSGFVFAFIVIGALFVACFSLLYRLFRRRRESEERLVNIT